MQTVLVTCVDGHPLCVVACPCPHGECLVGMLAVLAGINPPCPTCGKRDGQPTQTREDREKVARAAYLEATVTERRN